MRKISSKEEIQKKQRINQIIIGLVLIFVMLSSSIGFAFFSSDQSSNTNKLKYKGYEFFVNENNLWQLNIEEQVFQTNYNPSQTEDIVVDFDFSVSDLAGKPLYYVPDNQNALTELSYNLVRFSSRDKIQEVCLKGEECEGNLIEKTCSDNIIVFKQSSEINTSQSIKLYKRENCVFIEAMYQDQIRAVDRLIFKALGVQ